MHSPGMHIGFLTQNGNRLAKASRLCKQQDVRTLAKACEDGQPLCRGLLVGHPRAMVRALMKLRPAFPLFPSPPASHCAWVGTNLPSVDFPPFLLDTCCWGLGSAGNTLTGRATSFWSQPRCERARALCLCLSPPSSQSHFSLDMWCSAQGAASSAQKTRGETGARA